MDQNLSRVEMHNLALVKHFIFGAYLLHWIKPVNQSGIPLNSDNSSSSFSLGFAWNMEIRPLSEKSTTSLIVFFLFVWNFFYLAPVFNYFCMLFSSHHPDRPLVCWRHQQRCFLWGPQIVRAPIKKQSLVRNWGVWKSLTRKADRAEGGEKFGVSRSWTQDL